MATANLKDRPTPPPLPPPPRFMDEAVNGQASGWSWPGSASQRRSQSPPATDNETVGGAEYEPTFIAQRSASDLERSSRQRPPMHSRNSVSGNNVAHLAINTSLNNPVHELRSRPSISLTRPAVMPNPAPAEGLTLLQTDQGFHGEKPLSARSVEQSNNAYDQSLLSKLGGPESARSSISSLGGSAGKSISTLPFHSKSRPSVVGISSTDPSLSPGEETSPPPFTFSANPSRNPSIVRSTLFDNISYQSPSAGNVVPTSVEVDPLTQIERRPTLTKHRIIEDITGYSARVPRRSYDVNSYRSINNQDNSFSRHLSLDESRSRRHENTAARLGIKRRASSPPRELNHHLVSFGAYPFGTSELSHRNSSSGFLGGFTTPGSRYHGSISSLSSYPSYRNPSLASSTGFSAAASSMTSVEGPLSPMSDLESPYENVVSPNTRASISGLSLQSRPIPREPETRCGSTARKLSTIPDFQTTKSRPTKVGQVYICECCSKKHKKFDNLQDLRAHEMEKQYPCQYCHKRFKNRNEAERHRNSLHLRRHSWSCAALRDYQAAFHPSSATSYQTANGPAHDICGFCGEEFPNFPEPNWDARIEHLTSVHKYRECNQSKKFYRADHFRQHLRHSHAGTSGKWTNTLENACMREENTSDAGLASIDEQEPPYRHDTSEVAIQSAVHPSLYFSQHHAVDDVGET